MDKKTTGDTNPPQASTKTPASAQPPASEKPATPPEPKNLPPKNKIVVFDHDKPTIWTPSIRDDDLH